MTALRSFPAAVIGALIALCTPLAASTQPAQAAQLVPAGFTVPVAAQAATFKLVPLGPALVKIDYEAYMSSIDHLQRTFTRSTDWPHKNLTAADAMADMENEAARFRKRESFAYGVLTPDGRRERGSEAGGSAFSTMPWSLSLQGGMTSFTASLRSTIQRFYEIAE